MKLMSRITLLVQLFVDNYSQCQLSFCIEGLLWTLSIDNPAIDKLVELDGDIIDNIIDTRLFGIHYTQANRQLNFHRRFI